MKSIYFNNKIAPFFQYATKENLRFKKPSQDDRMNFVFQRCVGCNKLRFCPPFNKVPSIVNPRHCEACYEKLRELGLKYKDEGAFYQILWAYYRNDSERDVLLHAYQLGRDIIRAEMLISKL